MATKFCSQALTGTKVSTLLLSSSVVSMLTEFVTLFTVFSAVVIELE